MTEPKEPQRLVLRFVTNRRRDGARLITYHKGDLIILGERYERSDEVQDGEEWECNVWEKIAVKVAEPLKRVQPPEADATPAPSPPPASPAAPPQEPTADAAVPPVVEVPPALAPAPAAHAAGGNGNHGHEPRPPLLRVLPKAPRAAPLRPTPLSDLDLLVSPDDRVAVFVDGPSMEHASRILGWKIGWEDAIAALPGPGLLTGAYYYTFDEADSRHRAYLQGVNKAGFKIRPVPTRAEELESNAMLAVALAIDAASLSGTFEVAFLLTVERSFVPLAQVLHARNKRVYLVTIEHDGVADLALYVDKPILYLGEIREIIEQG